MKKYRVIKVKPVTKNMNKVITNLKKDHLQTNNNPTSILDENTRVVIFESLQLHAYALYPPEEILPIYLLMPRVP